MNELLEVTIKAVAAVGVAIAASLAFIRRNLAVEKAEFEKIFTSQIDALKQAHAQDIAELRGRVSQLEAEVHNLTDNQRKASTALVRISQNSALPHSLRDEINKVLELLR